MPIEQNARWRPLLKPAIARRLQKLALDIATRLIDPCLIERAVASAKANTREPASIYWRPYGIAQGDAGLALMYGYFDACFPGDGWDRVAHQWIEKAVRGAESAPDLPDGLFEGLSGLAYTVAYLSRDGLRYRNLHQKLHSAILRRVPVLCEEFDRNRGNLPFLAWDLIAGLTGMGVYLLSYGDDVSVQPILSRLIALTGETQELPHWHTPARFMYDDWTRNQYPEGQLNCGLAHGIPGPLALLSLARLKGWKRAGLDEAIDRIASWLARHIRPDAWGTNWPSAIPLVRDADRLTPGSCDHLAPTHAAWCYGSPGIARSLWLAGNALGDASHRALALDVMHAIHRRPAEARQLHSPAFYGVAGLLCITLRFRHDVPDDLFSTLGHQLLRQVESMYEPDSLLGYRTTEPGGGRIDQAGLLDGAPGIAMSLLAAATNQVPSWDRLFLLS